VFEKKLLENVRGWEGEAVTGEGRKCAMRCLIISTLPNNIRAIRLRSMRWWAISHLLGEIRNKNKFLVQELERKGPLGRPGRRFRQ
jgi:hypothetical protein